MHALPPRVVSWFVLAVFGDPTGGDVPRRRAAVGVLGAVTVLTVLGTLHAFGTPPFAPPDETAHVAYALSLTQGVIPHIATFPAELPVPGMPEGLSTWTANHPPGAYALMAVPLWLGVELGEPLVGFWVARLLNVVGSAVAVVFAARIVGLLLPQRPRVVVGVAMLTAMVPYAVHIAGTAYTDGLASAATVGLLAVAVEVLVLGPSRGRLLAMCAASAVAALMRAPSVVLVLLAGTSWGVAHLLHGPARLPGRIARGVGGAALIGLSALVAAGWFFIGNVALYGDPTGSAALFELHGRSPRGTFWEVFSASHQYRFQELQLWSKMEGLPDGSDYVVSGYFVQDVHRIILVLLWTAAVLTVWHVWRTRLRGEGRVVAVWVLLATWWWALMAMMASFVSQGGAPHARYLWPAFTGLALLLVLPLDAVRLRLGALGRRARRLDGLPVGLYAALGALTWANAYAYPRMLELFAVAAPGRDLPWATVQMFSGRQLPSPGWLAVGSMLGLVAGLGAIAWSLWATPSHAGPIASVPLSGPPDTDR